MSHDINPREYDAWKLAAPPEPKPCERCGGDMVLDCPECVWWTWPILEDECEICHGKGYFACPDCAE